MSLRSSLLKSPISTSRGCMGARRELLTKRFRSNGARGAVLVSEATAPDVLARARLDRDCVRPEAGLSVDCEAGGVLATVRARGERPGRFLVFVDDAPAGEATVVPAGRSADIAVPVRDGRLSLIRVIESSRVEPVAVAWLLARCTSALGVAGADIAHHGVVVHCVSGGLTVEIAGDPTGYSLRRAGGTDEFDASGTVRVAALDGDRVRAEVLSEGTVVERLELVRDCGTILAGGRPRIDAGGVSGAVPVVSVGALGLGALLAAGWIRRREDGSRAGATG